MNRIIELKEKLLKEIEEQKNEIVKHFEIKLQQLETERAILELERLKNEAEQDH